MRFTIALLFAGVVSASLTARQTVPQCALTCIANADLGGCSATDNTCLCNNQQFVQSTASCIQSSCSGDDLANAIAFAQATCEAVGVTLTSTGAGSATSGVSGSATSATSPSTTTGSATSASSPASTSNAAAKQNGNGIPALAAAALGLAAFAL